VRITWITIVRLGRRVAMSEMSVTLAHPVRDSCVRSRPKHPAQPFALDVGSPRAAQAAGTCINESHVARFARSNQPGLFAQLSYSCAFVYIFLRRLHPARFANGRRPVPFRDARLHGRRDRR
jgi:hypothetical protein